jgi:hypothetical protein
MLPVNSSNAVQGVVNFFSKIPSKISLIAAAIFVALLGIGAGLAVMRRNVNRAAPQLTLVISPPTSGPRQLTPPRSSSPQPPRGMQTPRQQLDQITPKEFRDCAKRLFDLFETSQPKPLSMSEEKFTASISKILAVINSKPDAEFLQHGLIRNAVNKSDKEELKTELQVLGIGQRLLHPEAIPLDIAIAVFKDLVRERNFFGGKLQAEVVALVRDLRGTSEKPGLNEAEIVQRLQGMIAQLPEEQQLELMSFLGLLHRVSQLSDQNGVTVAVIANSLADIFSEVPAELAVQKVGLAINTVFTELLVTYYPQL